MPSVSTTTNYHFTNIGPLTTTFTAPASCATPGTTHLRVAASEHPSLALFFDYCPGVSTLPEFWRSDCLPSGSAINALTMESSIVPFPYFSPGIACPASWATVGVAAKDEDGSVSSNGVFQPFTASSLSRSPDVWNDPPPNELMNVMANGETAVLCCPSSFTYDLYGNCYTTLPFSAYTATTGCRIVGDLDDSTNTPKTFDYYGSTVTGSFLGADAISFGPVTITLDEEARSSMAEDKIALSYQQMVTLIHKGDETTATGTSGPSETGGDSDQEGDDGDSAAASIRPGSTSTAVAKVLGLWAVAAIAGACLVVPM